MFIFTAATFFVFLFLLFPFSLLTGKNKQRALFILSPRNVSVIYSGAGIPVLYRHVEAKNIITQLSKLSSNTTCRVLRRCSLPKTKENCFSHFKVSLTSPLSITIQLQVFNLNFYGYVLLFFFCCFKNACKFLTILCL